MAKMKKFLIYFLIFIGFYILSNWLISAYIKTSYYKIEEYTINVDEATITIMSAKASKDDGHIEGKIYNNTEEKVTEKYMKVELFSENDVSLGTKYVLLDELQPGDLKNFTIDFTYDNVTSFEISIITVQEKEEQENEETTLFNFEYDERVTNVTNSLGI